MNLENFRKFVSSFLSITVLLTNTVWPSVVFAQEEAIATESANMVANEPLMPKSTASAEISDEVSPPPTKTPEPTKETILDSNESSDLKEAVVKDRDVDLLQREKSTSLDKPKMEGSFSKEGRERDKDYVEGEVIVKFKKEKLDVKRTSGKILAYVFEKRHDLDKKDEIENLNIQVFESKKSTEELVKELKADPKVEYAEPNYLRFPTTINTNDPDRGLLWGLNNTGQTVNGTVGTNDADIDAPEAWGLSEGSGDVIVAIIDSGVAYNHPDLINNMWDGTDCKDENGDALGGCNSGYDYEDDDKDPAPSTSSHGTHVAGTIAAEKNNGKGIIGVAPSTKIMAIKTVFSTTEIVKGIDFAIQNGAKIINASFSGNSFSQSEYDAISRFKWAGGIFIAAAGNGTLDSSGWDGVGKDNDSVSHIYPCDYDSANIVCVAATDQNDGLADFSDYGSTSVDVGAPGTNIYSTVPQETTVLFETFEGVAPPAVPAGFVSTGNWQTYDRTSTWGSAWGKVLYGDFGYPYTNNTNTTVTSPSYNLRVNTAPVLVTPY